MAHKDWCGSLCADCANPCTLDQSIPCSPDCKFLRADGSRKAKDCKAVECDALISRIAIISSGFVRGAQVFQGPSEALEESEDTLDTWEKHGYIDIGAADLFVGVLDSTSEDGIKSLIVTEWGVHPDAVQLIQCTL